MPELLTSEQLIHVIKSTSPTNPKFTLLLGAGASVSSGIKSGIDLVSEWREIYEAKGKLLKDQAWHERPSEYSELFEFILPEKANRRDFIETCISESSPSWGYLYLADLIEKGFFNIVLTTNFDDLINEACLQFTVNSKPLVCSEDANINHFRITSPRPKIIKLHGDFLFDNIKNTPKEVGNLEENMKQKLKWLANEYGLIVIGYGGNDESVMSVIGELLNEGCNFPSGLYWCIRKDSSYNDRIESFTHKEKFHIVEIENFDSLMAKFHSELIDKSPSIISDPHKSLYNKLSHLLSGLEVTEELAENSPNAVSRDLKLLGKSLNKSDVQYTVNLPNELLATLHFSNEEYNLAIPLFLNSIEDGNPKIASLIHFFECLRYHWDSSAFEKATAIIEANIDSDNRNNQWLPSAAISLIHGKRFEEADKICRLAEIGLAKCDEETDYLKTYNRLNLFQLTLHKGDELSKDEINEIRTILKNTNQKATQFGCHILLGNHDTALDLVINNLDSFPESTGDWPIIQLMPTAQLNVLNKTFDFNKKHYGEIHVQYPVQIKANNNT